jgi:hypothetical protein
MKIQLTRTFRTQQRGKFRALSAYIKKSERFLNNDTPQPLGKSKKKKKTQSRIWKKEIRPGQKIMKCSLKKQHKESMKQRLVF